MGKKKKSKTVTNPTVVDPVQQAYLTDLYSKAQAAANATPDPRISGTYGQMADFSYGQDVYGGMNTAADWLQSFRNPEVDPAFAAYAQNMGQQFREQILPSLKGQSIMAGGLGATRGRIGEALGGQRAMQSISDFGANAYAGQQQRSLQAAGQYGTAMQNIAQLRGSELGIRQQGAAGLQQLPWYGLNQYRSLLGPAVLQGGGGYSKQSEGGGIGGVLQGAMAIAPLALAPFTGGASLAAYGIPGIGGVGVPGAAPTPAG